MSHEVEQAASVVQRGFPALHGGRLVALGNHGGFSGARLWKVETPSGTFCLRAWPPNGPTGEALNDIHAWMRIARVAGLAFVPDVLSTSGGSTWFPLAGRLWEATRWLPGRADFRDRPTPERMEAACAALALLHQAWASVRPEREPCPAIQRRLERYQHWCKLVQAGWRPLDFGRVDDVIRPWAMRAWHALLSRMDDVPRHLAPWQGRHFPLQPCLCDIWHDHILFENDTVTGLIDYGAVKRDHVAVDLARLLGSFAGDDAVLRGVGLKRYASLRPLTLEEHALITVLDHTGVLLGAANWLIWLYHENRSFPNRAAAADRLASLVERIEVW